MSKQITDVNLVEVLPPSISADPGIEASSTALDLQLQDINVNTKQVRILSRIPELSSEVLDMLAWQFHVDIWSENYTLERKWEKIQSSLITHSYKGTVWAVKEAARLEGYTDVTIDKSVGDWWEFTLEATAEPGVSSLDILMGAIEAAKNLRSKLFELKINLNAQAPLKVGAAVCIYVEV